MANIISITNDKLDSGSVYHNRQPLPLSLNKSDFGTTVSSLTIDLPKDAVNYLLLVGARGYSLFNSANMYIVGKQVVVNYHTIIPIKNDVEQISRVQFNSEHQLVVTFAYAMNAMYSLIPLG